mmetsp:Transcript_139556/g.242832  ORF Transcript_139556/g.242832 Transcript_139556/m.242832 type:complete len:106 (-) Transcript_139556:2643-2960(-)
MLGHKPVTNSPLHNRLPLHLSPFHSTSISQSPIASALDPLIKSAGSGMARKWVLPLPNLAAAPAAEPSLPSTTIGTLPLGRPCDPTTPPPGIEEPLTISLTMGLS